MGLLSLYQGRIENGLPGRGHHWDSRVATAFHRLEKIRYPCLEMDERVKRGRERGRGREGERKEGEIMRDERDRGREREKRKEKRREEDRIGEREGRKKNGLIKGRMWDKETRMSGKRAWSSSTGAWRAVSGRDKSRRPRYSAQRHDRHTIPPSRKAKETEGGRRKPRPLLPPIAIQRRGRSTNHLEGLH